MADLLGAVLLSLVLAMDEVSIWVERQLVVIEAMVKLSGSGGWARLSAEDGVVPDVSSRCRKNIRIDRISGLSYSMRNPA